MAEPITSLPWVADNDDGNWRISSRDEQCTVAFVGHQSSLTAAGDAALIERAVNHHNPLVTALEGLLMENGHSAGCLAGNGVSLPCELFCANARTALAAAREI